MGGIYYKIAGMPSRGRERLRGIVCKAIPKNQFHSIRLDLLADDINQRIEAISSDLVKIQTSTKIIIGNEKLNLLDFSGFTDFKKRIEKKDALKFQGEISQKFIKNKAKEINKENEDLNHNIEYLSYKYAHLAILARENKQYLAAATYLKKATELNSEHIHALLHEKAEKAGDIETLKRATPIDLNGMIKKYKKLIESENGIKKTELIKEAIQELIMIKIDTSTNNEQKTKSEEIESYIKILNIEYKDNTSVRDIYKYKELADFYYKLTEKQDQASYFYNLTKLLLEKSQKTDERDTLLEEVNEKLNALKNNKNINTDDNLLEIESRAKEIILNNEDKEVKSILISLYDEVKDLKSRERYQEEITTMLLDSLFSLNINIDTQIIQNRNSNLNNHISNKNSEKLLSISNEIQSLLTETPKKYNLTLNNEVKNEIIDVITGSSNEFTDVLRENNQSLLKKTNSIIDAADKQIRFLLDDAKKDREDFLASINKESSIAELQNIKNEIIAEIKKTQKITKESIKKSRIADHKKHLIIEKYQRIITGFMDEVEKLEPLINRNTTKAESNFTEIKNNLQSIKASHDDFSKNTAQALQVQHLKSGDMEETLTGNHIEISNEISETKKKIINLLNKHHYSKKSHLISAIKALASIALLLGIGFILDNIKLY
jgi:hypothetical protein